MDVFAQLKSHWYVHSTHSYNSMEVLPHGINMVITSMLEPNAEVTVILNHPSPNLLRLKECVTQ